MRRLDIYIHHPVTNASRRVVRDANQAYEIKVRQMATGSDFTVRLFAASQADAEERAKQRAMREYKVSPEKLRELEGKGIGVFRIVSSKVSPDQSRPNDKSFADTISDTLIGGNHRPEGKHAKSTPVDDAVGDEIQYRGYIIMERSDGTWEIDGQGGGLPPAKSLTDAKRRIDEHKAGRS